MAVSWSSNLVLIVFVYFEDYITIQFVFDLFRSYSGFWPKAKT